MSHETEFAETLTKYAYNNKPLPEDFVSKILRINSPKITDLLINYIKDRILAKKSVYAWNIAKFPSNYSIYVNLFRYRHLIKNYKTNYVGIWGPTMDIEALWKYIMPKVIIMDHYPLCISKIHYLATIYHMIESKTKNNPLNATTQITHYMRQLLFA